MENLFLTIMVILNLVAALLWGVQILFAYLENNKICHSFNQTPNISVIIPAFNEEQHTVDKVICHLRNQKHVKLQIILVDDGSEAPVTSEYEDIKVVKLAKNLGKRYAQAEGLKYAIYDWILTLDSDTFLLDNNAVNEIYNTAISRKADAVCGTVYLDNCDQNMLTRMTSCMYWFSFFQERASQSYFGNVTCCSGAMSLYRKRVILDNLDEYLNQQFLGSKCTAGDDRHMTLLFALSGNKVCWSKNSNSYTVSPPTLGKFIKQQVRWSRSHIASVFYMFKNINKCRLSFLFFNIKFLFKYFYSMAVYAYALSMLLFYSHFMYFGAILLGLFIISGIKIAIALLYTRDKKFLCLFPYAICSFFILQPILLYGAFTPFVKKWSTRS